jgi:sugar phosphate isomerase/epimerase
LALRKTTGAANLGVLVDLWHWHVGGGTIAQLRELSPEQIVTVRMASVPEDVAVGSATDQQRLPPETTGLVDNVGALSLLSEMGYRGPVAAYPHPSRLKGQTRDRIVQRTAEGLEAVWVASGLEKPSSRALTHA